MATKQKKIRCPHCSSQRPFWERWCNKCGKFIGNTKTKGDKK